MSGAEQTLSTTIYLLIYLQYPQGINKIEPAIALEKLLVPKGTSCAGRFVSRIKGGIRGTRAAAASNAICLVQRLRYVLGAFGPSNYC